MCQKFVGYMTCDLVYKKYEDERPSGNITTKDMMLLLT